MSNISSSSPIMDFSSLFMCRLPTGGFSCFSSFAQSNVPDFQFFYHHTDPTALDDDLMGVLLEQVPTKVLLMVCSGWSAPPGSSLLNKCTIYKYHSPDHASRTTNLCTQNDMIECFHSSVRSSPDFNGSNLDHIFTVERFEEICRF
jgi:hypothetical protein